MNLWENKKIMRNCNAESNNAKSSKRKTVLNIKLIVRNLELTRVIRISYNYNIIIRSQYISKVKKKILFFFSSILWEFKKKKKIPTNEMYMQYI